MSEFSTKCPFCGTEVQAQSDWIGMEAACPDCGESFEIHAPEKSMLQKGASILDIRRRYRFGLSFIALSWVVAPAFLLFSIYTLVVTVNNRIADVRMKELMLNNCEEKKSYIEVIKKLQDDFTDSYSRSVNALTMRKSVTKMTTPVLGDGKEVKKKEATPEGLTIPGDLSNVSCYFNQDLIVVDDIEESIDTMKQMEDKIEKLHEIFYHQVIAKFDSNGNVFSVKKKNKGQSIKLAENDNGYNLYLEAQRMYDCIRGLRLDVENKTSDQTIKLDTDLEKLKKQLLFFEQNLFRFSGKSTQLEASRSNIDAYAEFGKSDEAKQQLCAILITLNKGWKVDDIGRRLKGKLQDYRDWQINEEEKIEFAWENCKRECIYLAFKEIFSALLVSFLIVVFADYLKAHFDMATKICEEK